MLKETIQDTKEKRKKKIRFRKENIANLGRKVTKRKGNNVNHIFLVVLHLEDEVEVQMWNLRFLSGS